MRAPLIGRGRVGLSFCTYLHIPHGYLPISGRFFKPWLQGPCLLITRKKLWKNGSLLLQSYSISILCILWEIYQVLGVNHGLGSNSTGFAPLSSLNREIFLIVYLCNKFTWGNSSIRIYHEIERINRKVSSLYSWEIMYAITNITVNHFLEKKCVTRCQKCSSCISR